MTTKSRTYPDISYVETDTETIVNALIQGYEKIAGRTLYPADPARLFILWVADIIVQERVNIDFSAKQNIPRYAEGEYLDSLAELFKHAIGQRVEVYPYLARNMESHGGFYCGGYTQYGRKLAVFPNK